MEHSPKLIWYSSILIFVLFLIPSCRALAIIFFICSLVIMLTSVRVTLVYRGEQGRNLPKKVFFMFFCGVNIDDFTVDTLKNDSKGFLWKKECQFRNFQGLMQFRKKHFARSHCRRNNCRKKNSEFLRCRCR